MNSKTIEKWKEDAVAGRSVLCVATSVGVAFMVACGVSVQTPVRTLTEIKSCGTVLYSGYAGIAPTHISNPTPHDKETAPAPATALPPGAQDKNFKAGDIVLLFTSNCEHGDQVSVVPLNALWVGAIAHSKNGGISGLTLKIPTSQDPTPVTVYDYRGGQLVGIVHITA